MREVHEMLPEHEVIAEAAAVAAEKAAASEDLLKVGCGLRWVFSLKTTFVCL